MQVIAGAVGRVPR